MAPPPSIQQQHNSTRCTPRAKLHQPLQCVHSHNAHATRRRALLMQGGAAAAAWAVMQLQPATARQAPIDAGVPASESAYIQELLRRSEEKKEERKQERLNAYYKKVFKEYFEFEGPDSRTGKARGLKPETQAAISSWLQENK